MANPEHVQRLNRAIQDQAPIDLSDCDLSSIRFSSVPLAGAKLRGANLRGADLTGGYFRGCDLRDANCSRSRISTSDFREADLSGVNLTAADWSHAVLTGANLSGANLTRAKLVKARMDGVNLTRAILKGTDLRGVEGLTTLQLEAARQSDQAILDERTLSIIGRQGDLKIARLGKPTKKQRTPIRVDLLFGDIKPCFGDLFQICGFENPAFPITGDHGFAELADLGIQQVDEFFAICVDGDPSVWIFPLVNGKEVAHHPGPFDGLRLEADEARYKKRLLKCVARFESELRIPLSRQE